MPGNETGGDEHVWDFMQPATTCRRCGSEYDSARWVNCPGAAAVAIDWTAWQGDKRTACPSIHPDLDEQCSLGNGHAEAHRTTTYWSDSA